MAKIENVSAADLHEALAGIEGRKPTQRLLIAILYKAGPSVPMIADWFDMREDTVYAWLDRFEDEPIERAIHDAPRPGRPRKLEASQLDAFETAVRRPPEASGYDAPEWTPELARRFLLDAFDVEYTPRHVRRLLHRAGVRWARSGPRTTAGEQTA